MPDALYPEDAEVSVLGAILVNSHAIEVVSDILSPESFFLPSHGGLYKSMLDMWAKGEHIDQITVPRQYKNLAHHAAEVCPTASNAKTYAGIVDAYFRRRKLRIAGEQISQLAAAQDDPEMAAMLADAALSEAVRLSEADIPTSMEELCIGAYQRVEDAIKGVRHSGPPTRMPTLDSMIGGLGQGAFVIIGGSTGVGKTSLLLTIMSLITGEKRALIFSLEMTKAEILDRMLCAEAYVPITSLRTGDINDEQTKKLMESIPRLSELHLEIDDKSMNIGEIQRKVRRASVLKPIDVIGVDYLQLVSTGDKFESSVQEVTAISRALKLMAREHNACVIALSQLSRPSAEERNARPGLHRLRQSGALEQDADVVLFLHANEERMGPHVVELMVAKNRNGPTGHFRLRWEPTVARFYDDI